MTFIYWIIAILYFIASFHILIYSFEELYLSYLSFRKKKKLTNIKLSEYPFVTIQLPMYNEKYVAALLIDKICKIDYPHDKLEIQILDDSDDETRDIVQNKLLEYKNSNLVINYITRENRNGFKAGALKYGLEQAKGEFIAIFDADFQPKPDFLKETLAHFKDSKVGIIQTRWGYTNEDYSMLTKVVALLINNHFVIDQRGRFHGDHLLQFNGTGGIWRKTAIIDAGNWHADTIIEDVDLSIRAQLNGWKIVFLNDTVCPSELASDINSIKLQQFRWTQGAAEVAKKHLKTIWASNFSFNKKFHASLYLTSSYLFLSIFLTLILSVPMIYVMPALKIDLAVLGIFTIGLVLILYITFNPNYFITWKDKSRMDRIFRFINLFPVLIIAGMAISFHNSVALFKGSFGISTPFKRTPKFNFTEHSDKFKQDKKYRIKPSAISIVEFILIFYFSFGILIGISIKNYTFLFLHIILVIAFTGISFFSLKMNFSFLKSRKHVSPEAK